jgi:hypothetical protein
MDASIELYELNRSIIEQQGVLGADALAEKFELINTFAADTKNNFYMLYGREINYFTVFTKHEKWELETLALAVTECLANIGSVYSIELTAEKDAVEIWVKDIHQDLLTCMYLFPYDGGIVRIK